LILKKIKLCHHAVNHCHTQLLARQHHFDFKPNVLLDLLAVLALATSLGFAESRGDFATGMFGSDTWKTRWSSVIKILG
jgi:hypothetical protein